MQVKVLHFPLSIVIISIQNHNGGTAGTSASPAPGKSMLESLGIKADAEKRRREH